MTQELHEKAEELSGICRELGNKAHETPGDGQYMRALWASETTLRALSAALAAAEAERDALKEQYAECVTERARLQKALRGQQKFHRRLQALEGFFQRQSRAALTGGNHD